MLNVLANCKNLLLKLKIIVNILNVVGTAHPPEPAPAESDACSALDSKKSTRLKNDYA
jgi:hypothetical protein